MAFDIKNILSGSPLSPVMDLSEYKGSTQSSTPVVEDSTQTVDANVIGNSKPLPRISPPPIQTNVDNTLASLKAQAQALKGEISAMQAVDTKPAVDATSSKPNYAKSVLDLLSKDRSQEKQAIREQFGLSDKEEHSRKLYNEMLLREQDYKKQLEALEKNPDGKLVGHLNNDINELNRERSREMADRAIAYNIALGDYQAAEKAVGNRLSDMEADLDRQVKAYEMAFNFSQNDMTESEKLQAQQAFDREQTALKFKYDKELIAYRNKLDNANRSIADAESTQAAVQASLRQIPLVQDKIDLIRGIKNHEGLKRSVGTYKVSRWTPFSADKSEAQDFAGKVHLLTSRETIDALLNLKKQGGTLGALSEKEAEMLANAATKLNDWEKKDDNGFGTGRWEISEDRFVEELDRLEMLTQRALDEARGTALTVDEDSALDYLWSNKPGAETDYQGYFAN